MSWQQKVHRVIGKLAEVSYRQANYKNGSKYKRHRPYRISPEAEKLVSCVGDRDQVRGERVCKATMELLRRQGMEID